MSTHFVNESGDSYPLLVARLQVDLEHVTQGGGQSIALSYADLILRQAKSLLAFDQQSFVPKVDQVALEILQQDAAAIGDVVIPKDAREAEMAVSKRLAFALDVMNYFWIKK